MKQKNKATPPLNKPPFFFEAGSPEKQALPPKELWEGWGPDTAAYLSSGRVDVSRMLEILAGGEFKLHAEGKVLDFGCGSGRMLRWFPLMAPSVEAWGVDVNERQIRWCDRNLPESLRFLCIPDFPHLPFEDRRFDLIYAGSVFTHIHEYADCWLRELMRTLKDTGRIYVTVADRDAIQSLLEDERWQEHFLSGWLRGLSGLEDMLKADFERFGFFNGRPGSDVFHDRAYLERHWGRFARVVDIVPKGFGFQTVYVLAPK